MLHKKNPNNIIKMLQSYSKTKQKIKCYFIKKYHPKTFNLVISSKLNLN